MNMHPNLCTIENSLLVFIDLQSKLLKAMPENDADLMLYNCCKMAKAAEILKIPVLSTEQYPEGLGSTDHLLKEKFSSNVPVFSKTSFSCLEADGFKAALEQSQKKQIILMGMEAHICVLQTALQLAALNFQVYVIEDAVCSRRLEHKLYALQRMQQQKITITCYESVLFEWLQDAQHEKFKLISTLL